MLNIYYGRASVDQEKFIFSRIDPRMRTLIIVPDQYTMEAENRLFRETGAEAIMDCEVLSMSRLGYRLLNELGGSRRTFIDKNGRQMILSGVAMEQRDNLQVYRGLERRTSFLEKVNDFISEIKQYNCGLEELEQIRGSVEEGTYLYRKLSDLILLYGCYEEKIKGRYTDSEDYVDLFLSKISQSRLIRGNTVWVYGFDSFAPKARMVLGELMANAKDVNVVLTCSLNDRERDYGLFELTRTVMHDLEREASTRGVEHKAMPIPAGFDAYPADAEYDAVRHIEREIYALPAREIKGIEPPVMVEASNQYTEAESAACYVLHLLRDEGLRLQDIKIILNDQENYGPIVRRIFREYGLEIFADQGREVSENPIVLYIMSLFDCVNSDFETGAVITMLKTGFSGIEDFRDLADLENYAIKYRIKGRMWTKPFKRGLKEYGEEELARINGLREMAVAPILRFKEFFKATTYGEFVESFYGFLRDEIDLPSKIDRLTAAQSGSGREDLAEETDQVWDAVLGTLDQMREVIGSEAFDGETMRSLLTEGLASVRVGKLPPTQDSLLMGTMQRTRFSDAKALVVLGCNEGVLPKGNPGQELFGEEEKDLFRGAGIELLKSDPVKLLEEKMGIYRNLSAAPKLYISYYMADAEGKACHCSSVWNKLKEIFPEEKGRIMPDVVTAGDDYRMLNGRMSGLRHIANSLEDLTENGGDLSEPVSRGINWYKYHDPARLTQIRRGISFDNKVEDLGREAARELYRFDPERGISLSPSRIEKFSRCPFSYFVGYGLNPDERRVFETDSRSVGDIYHHCLKRLSDELTRDGMALTDPESPWMTVTDDELKAKVNGYIDEESAGYNEGVFVQGKAEEYQTGRIRESCYKTCRNLVDQVRAGTIERAMFEVKFGRSYTRPIDPIEIEVGEGEDASKVYIEGIIDRVDYLPGDRVKIIDYKTGNNKFKPDEARKGYLLQLMLYMEAAREKVKRPAGVFYYHISDPLIDVTDPKVAQNLAGELAKELRLEGVAVNDEEVIRSIAGDFTDSSDVLPISRKDDGSLKASKKLMPEEDFLDMEDTVMRVVRGKVEDLLRGKAAIEPMVGDNNTNACKYCEYKSICRFDKIFEGNKMIDPKV
ncbi:MAG: PD-(D/E)XK nuclease family protein [Firmicutes bacterium]|nr:PD-(D/E)XK nuclease family protein [Bacillota bacterium]